VIALSEKIKKTHVPDAKRNKTKEQHAVSVDAKVKVLTHSRLPHDKSNIRKSLQNKMEYQI